MINIANNGIITMNKGEDISFPLFVIDHNNIEIYKPQLGEFDHIYFSVTEHGQPFECGFIRKILGINDVDDEGRVIITFNSNDTAFMLPGNYLYEVKTAFYEDTEDQLVTEPKISTLISQKKFIILE